MPERDEGRVREEIAVVGMAGRFPGARTVAELWQNLCRGVESVTFFTPEEVLASGVPPAVLRDPLFVNAAALMDDADGFDAAFFGFTPREAELMDPQHRVFLECAWEALEDAGLDPEAHGGAIGVFGGVGPNTYFRHCLASHPELLEMVGPYQVMARQRRALPDHPRVLQAEPHRAEPQRPDGLLDLAGGHPPGLPEPAGRGMRHRARRWRSHSGALTGGYLYQEGGILSRTATAGRSTPRPRGTVFGSGVAHRGPQAPVGRPRGTATRSTRSSRDRRSTTTAR